MAKNGPVGEFLHYQGGDIPVAQGQEFLSPLAEHLQSNIFRKVSDLLSQGLTVEFYDPDWCRENPKEAGRLHADVIIKTYGKTYALPNKDPEANSQAIAQGGLDIYLMLLDGDVVGTTCLVDNGDGRAELGRSASLGKVGNSIIQDLRILDWITNSDTNAKYHSLFATLRNAPDRFIDDVDGEFTMRGGQGVTEHWKKFPGLIISGFGPLYLKHGMLEQFSIATLSRLEFDQTRPLFISDTEAEEFVRAWHENYGFAEPLVNIQVRDEHNELPKFETHYPPEETGLTELVHADIIATNDGMDIEAAVKVAEIAKSPFTQIVLPIDKDTRAIQVLLKNKGFQIFGYQPAYTNFPPSLLYGRVYPGVEVVATFWDHDKTLNPLWNSFNLSKLAERISESWKNSRRQ